MLRKIYIHYDSVSNHILSYGVPFGTGSSLELILPKNLLLLNNPGGSPLAVYDTYTGFYYVSGIDKVREFLQQESTRKSVPSNWIDFDSLEFVHQLTPQEIADLLYISHTKSHLHSPFFYKLQNNFIFLGMENGFTKIYFRNIDQFYLRLQRQLTQQMEDVRIGRSKKSFFFNKPSVSKQREIPLELVKELATYFKEGALLALDHIQVTDMQFGIPIFLAEDRLNFVPNMSSDAFLGYITYDEQDQLWDLQLVDDDFFA